MRTDKILIFTFLIFLLSCSTDETTVNAAKQSYAPADTSNEQIPPVKQNTNIVYNVTVHDTFFFRRTISPYTDIVFIDKNRKNEFYKSLQHKEHIDLSGIYEYFKTPLKRTNTSSLPDKWIEIIKYNGEFYVYRPSNDSYNLNQFIINDSLFISCFSDPYIRTLTSFTKANKKKYELTLLNVDYETDKKVEEKMNIYEVDPKKQVFLFEHPGTNDSSVFYFATPVKNVFAFDLIDIYNSDMKSFSDVSEDKINFKELINKL